MTTAPGPVPTAKICTLCGDDCSARPRVKDAQGRYACRACAEARRTNGAPPLVSSGTPEASAAHDPSGFDILAGFDPAQAAPKPRELLTACPGCGTPLPLSSVVCVSCGHNRNTGKAARTRIQMSEADGAEAAATAIKTGGLIGVMFAAGGIAATVCAGVWIAIALEFGIETPVLLLGMGLLIGGAVRVAARGYTCGVSGSIAALLTLVAVVGAKLGATYAVVESEIQSLSAEDIYDEACLTWIADERCGEREANGVPIAWPDPGMTIENAVWPDDYPPDIQDEATGVWNAMSTQEQEATREEVAQWLQANADQIAAGAIGSTAWIPPPPETPSYRRGRGYVFGLLCYPLCLFFAFSVASGNNPFTSDN